MKDRYGRTIDYLRLSLTEACNYRCSYCMPEGASCSNRQELSLEDIIKLIEVFQSLGVRKVRLTGGEPLVRKDLADIISGIKGLGIEEVALTTNGALLKDQAAQLKAAGLDRVNVSLDTLDAEKFKQLTGRGRLDQVLAGLDQARQVGLTPIKINTVLIKGFNDGELADLLEWAGAQGFILRFIELMPIGQGISYQDSFLALEEIRNEDFEPVASGDPHSPASYYRYRGESLVGFIEPLTCSFCQQCNRLRLDAQGNLMTCLHSEASQPLAPFLGDPKRLKEEILKAVSLKPAAHQLAEEHFSYRRMNTIGG